jgi:WD40 repeat protein
MDENILLTCGTDEIQFSLLCLQDTQIASVHKKSNSSRKKKKQTQRALVCTFMRACPADALSCFLMCLQGTQIASTDAEGVVKLWDVRMVAEVETLNLGPQPANRVVFDRSGTVLIVASNSSRIHVVLLGAGAGESAVQLAGHEGEVQAVALCPRGETLVSAGADHTFRVWG